MYFVIDNRFVFVWWKTYFLSFIIHVSLEFSNVWVDNFFSMWYDSTSIKYAVMISSLIRLCLQRIDSYILLIAHSFNDSEKANHAWNLKSMQ
jgi:hypothetical protein